MTQEDQVPNVPDLVLAQQRFFALFGPREQRDSAQKQLIEAAKKEYMTPFYVSICQDFKVPMDQSVHKNLIRENESQLQKMNDYLKDAKDNLGETEISEALIKIANYKAKIGEKENAVQAFETASESTPGLGQRIDIQFAILRVGLFHSDNELISKTIEKTKDLINEGGDWDRRNRLKVYEGTYLLSVRDFPRAAQLFLETLSTFTSTELYSYKDFVKYTVLSGAISLKRPDLKSKVIDSPEILEVLHEIPNLEEFAPSLFDCKYAQFYKILAALEPQLKYDRYLSAHYRFYVREMRILAYKQLLESYISLTLESMANAFSVSKEFIDQDLSRFISTGRLNCVIDKINGVVETNQPDVKNSQYQAVIKQGDALLNRIQKLSKVFT